MNRMSYRDALHPYPTDPMPLDDDTIVQFALPDGVLEIRHTVTHIEVRSTAGPSKRFLIEPRAGNVIELTLEP
jgi:hypothetical protein